MSRLVPDCYSSAPLFDDFSTMYSDFGYSPSMESKLVSFETRRFLPISSFHGLSRPRENNSDSSSAWPEIPPRLAGAFRRRRFKSRTAARVSHNFSLFRFSGCNFLSSRGAVASVLAVRDCDSAALLCCADDVILVGHHGRWPVT